MSLHGSGFIVTPEEAKKLGLGTVPGLEKHVRPYMNGRDLTQTSRGVMVIDLYDLSEREAREKFPQAYQWVYDRVRPERLQNREDFRKKYWWWFGRRHTDFRSFVTGLNRFISTVETSKHRFFVFLNEEIRPDNMLVNIGIDDAWYLAVLSSGIHVTWALAAGGRLGVGNDPRYNKTRCFDPFPFPDPDEPTKQRLRELGERLDAFRKERQAEHPDLTMTGMYNVLERLRELDADPSAEPLSDKEKAIHEKGLVSVLRQIHDEIDAAVFEAYGWPRDLAEEEILERLVALNRERAEEERRGQVRWLRPDYQIPKFGKGLETGEQVEAEMDVPAIAAQAPKWPSKLPDQIRLVREELSRAQGPMAADEISKAFKGGRKRAEKVTELLESLAMLGQVRKDEGRYFMVERG
ncbi:type IIL restriction-modification enzyme MmeI [Parvibaculum indicum]|uniref:type IIL restriction-modification enzyme MmeI n=1 Tax=Parvibaculum indicum TaxID=562969 RepID=UPI0031B59D67